MISWEYIENNLRGRMTDYAQVRIKKIPFVYDNAGVGIGSMHTAEAMNLMPGDPSYQDAVCERMNAYTAIPLIAEFISNAAETFYIESNGIFIRDNPVVMSYFYNTGIEKAGESGRNHKFMADAYKNQSGVVDLSVLVNPMALWINSNLKDFVQYRTYVNTPPEVHVYANAV